MPIEQHDSTRYPSPGFQDSRPTQTNEIHQFRRSYSRHLPKFVGIIYSQVYRHTVKTKQTLCFFGPDLLNLAPRTTCVEHHECFKTSDPQSCQEATTFLIISLSVYSNLRGSKAVEGRSTQACLSSQISIPDQETTVLKFECQVVSF